MENAKRQEQAEVFLMIFPETADVISRAGSITIPLINAAIGGAALFIGLIIPLRRARRTVADQAGGG